MIIEINYIILILVIYIYLGSVKYLCVFSKSIWLIINILCSFTNRLNINIVFENSKQCY